MYVKKQKLRIRDLYNIEQKNCIEELLIMTKLEIKLQLLKTYKMKYFHYFLRIL